MLTYLKAVAIGVDVLANAVIGGKEYQTISCRIGLSIMGKGWASRVPWPRFALDHFIGAVYSAVV